MSVIRNIQEHWKAIAALLAVCVACQVAQMVLARRRRQRRK